MAEFPLSGVRILDFTWAWQGPFCTQLLAHLGAEVIRVESALKPCVTRAIPPFADDVPGPNRAGYFNQYNQSKRSLTLNLRKPEAREIIYRLVPLCDVVAENFAAGVIDRLGFGYDKLRQIRPDIIMISLSGYGQNGPYREYIGYGPPAGAIAGMYSVTGYEGGEPSEIGISYPDPNCGVFGAFAVMAALVHRDNTGEGQYIDQSQWEAALAVMPEGTLEYAMNGTAPPLAGNHDLLMSPHETYKAAGDADQWVSIAVGSEDEWRALCRVMDRPELAEDPRFSTAENRKRNEKELDQIITAWTRERDRWEVTRMLQEAGVAAFPSLSNKDLAQDDHLAKRGYLVALEHPEVGRRIHAGIPWKMSHSAAYVRSPAPLRGEANEYVLKDLLNYSQEEIEELRAAEVLV